MAGDYHGGGPRKSQKKPSKQELAENALQYVKYLTKEEILSKKRAMQAKSEAIRFAVEAGECLEQAEKRITNILRAVRRHGITKGKRG